MDSNANDLTARLRRRLETERRQIEELTANELERRGENSRRGASSALRSIERDMEDAGGRMREMLAEIGETTWGVGLREVSGVRYVTLPAGTPVLTALMVDWRPYVELSRE